MQNSSQIEKFLKGKLSYKEAVSLFFEISGKTKVAETLLSIGENVTNRSYLSNYFRSLQPEPEPEPEPITPEPIIIQTNRFERIIEPEHTEIKSIRAIFDQEWKQAYRERGHLHGRLHEAISDETRYEIAQQLMKIQGEIDGFNVLKDEFDRGIIPQKYMTQKLSAETYNRIKNLRFYIQRESKKLNNCTEKERVKIENRIEEFTNEINQLL